MSDFLIAMGPIVFFWCVPLLPLIYCAIAATVEAAGTALRSGLRASRSVEQAIATTAHFPHVDAATARELST